MRLHIDAVKLTLLANQSANLKHQFESLIYRNFPIAEPATWIVNTNGYSDVCDLKLGIAKSRSRHDDSSPTSVDNIDVANTNIFSTK